MNARYTIRERSSGGHGDLYELEEEQYFDVVETATGKVMMTFENHAFSTMGNGTWERQSISGVSSVVWNEDEGCLVVRSFGTDIPVMIRIP